MDRFSQARRSSDPAVVSTRGPVQGTRGTVRRRPQVEVSPDRLAFRPGIKTRKPLNIALGRVLLTPKRVLYLEASWLQAGEVIPLRLLSDDQVVRINVLGRCT
jgi:hypothetical protein